MTESWLPVIRYEGLYEASDQGRVRSVDRRVRYSRWGEEGTKLLRGKLLKPEPGNTDGRYLYVSLSKEGATCLRSVHSLVLEAFVGPRPLGMLGCHANDNGHDNYLENLRWGTHGDNLRDRYRNREVVIA